MSICPTCSQENPDIARFCLHCGTALATAAHREERRVVSVLFVDIVGFTSRSELLDPEDVRAFLKPYYEHVRREIEARGGRIEKFVGDAVLGIFGAPVAHGDDAERAVRTALAIRDSLGEMNVVDRELDLQARLAVNTGEVIVDLDARPEAGDSMVVGDVVNTAARLQSAAPANGVLVGRETYAATRTAVEYEPAPPVIAKGKAAPVAAWLALSADAPAGHRTLSEAPLVGRARELDVLSRLWAQVCEERRPHLVTVIGPAGIGKSRLAEEFAHFVEGEGGRPLRGRSAPYGDSSAYGAFAQHIKQVAEIFDNESADVVRAKLRRVADCDDELTDNLALFLGFETERAVDRETLFFAARRFVEQAARQQPTLLVFEDIHWADTSLLDLIEVLSSRTEDVCLLIVVLTRPELFADRPAWGGGLLSATALSLDPLGAGEALELATQLLTRGAGDYAAHLAATAEGNPLFIEELAAVVAERGSSDAQDLPTTIRSILEARLDALEPDERAVLLDASVAGKVFWRGLVEKLQNRSVGIGELLGALEARGLIRREAVSRIQGETQYSFKHGLIRQVAYASVPRARRRERHAEVARFLEEATTETGVSASILAYHWNEAADVDRAVAYFTAAADHAGRGWAKERAVELYNEAFKLLPEGDARRRDLGRKRAVAFQALYHVPDAANLARRVEQ
ncbi:MAG: AAA family ATPase [Gaiellaceae bacterium]